MLTAGGKELSLVRPLRLADALANLAYATNHMDDCVGEVQESRRVYAMEAHPCPVRRKRVTSRLGLRNMWSRMPLGGDGPRHRLSNQGPR